MRNAFKLLIVLLPWMIRRHLLEIFFGYELHPTSYIGLAWVFPGHLVMEAHTAIRHLTVCVHLDSVYLHQSATIGRGNWITGFPTGTDSPHFQHETDRRAELVVGEHAAITNRHLIDATNSVMIGPFATLAGFQSQVLTHSIDVAANRQSSAPIRIGAYTFIGTNCVILGGSVLPDRSVLGAKSLLNKPLEQTDSLYGGVPARWLAALPTGGRYFERTSGYVE